MKTTNELAAVQGNPAETWDEERIAATGLVPELEAQGDHVKAPCPCASSTSFGVASATVPPCRRPASGRRE